MYKLEDSYKLIVLTNCAFRSIEYTFMNFEKRDWSNYFFHVNPNSSASLRKCNGRTEATLIQLACGPVPEGHSRWTLRLLEEKARIELDTPISKDTIGRILKKWTSTSSQWLLVHPTKRKRRIRSLYGGYPWYLRNAIWSHTSCYLHGWKTIPASGWSEGADPLFTKTW